MVQKKIFLAATILVAFLFLVGGSNCQAVVNGTSTPMTTVPIPYNKVKENDTLPALRIELSTATDTLSTISVTVATTTNATSTALTSSSFNWLGIFKDMNSNGVCDLGIDIVLATTTTNVGATTTVNIGAATSTYATGTFFVVLSTAGTSTFTDNGYPHTSNNVQKFTLTIPSNGVTATSSGTTTIATINTTTTQPFIADTHSQAPATSSLSAFYQSGNYYLQEISGQTLGEQGTTTVYNTSTSTTPIATAVLGPNGTTTGPISLGSSYLSSVWLELIDIFDHPTSTRVQYNLPAQPAVTSIKAFTDRIIFNTSKNLRGDQAMTCSNYTVSGSALNCAGPGYPFIDFFGNQVVIKGLNLTSGSQISFSVSGIQDIDTDQFPLSYSTTTLLVQTASIPIISSVSPNSTSTGGTVTITGSNFGTATGTVLFSGGFSQQTGPLPPVSASTTAWTSTSITATVPSGANSGPVQVITSDGIMSDISQSSFFDVLTTVYFKLVNTTTTNPITTSTNMRIFVGSPTGENIYYVSDSQGTSFNGSTYVYTVPNISSMGFSWAYNIAGTYLSSPGSELQTNTSSTNPMILTFQGTSTRKVSGTITLGGTGASCTSVGQNKWVAAMAMPEGVETTMGPGGPQPSFFWVGSNCTTTYAVALPGNGIFRTESHLPPFSASSTPLLDPSGQTITITDSTTTVTVNFTFTAANRSIYGRVVGGDGNPLDSQKYNELWVFAFQPKTDGKSNVTRANSSGYFRLYATEGVYKIGVGGPMMPFPIEKDITVDSSATFTTTSTVVAITIKLEPPTTYISGYVKDGSGNGIGNVDIYCWCQGGPGGGHAFTDSQGYYKMYVSLCSNYHVGGYAKNYGQLTEQSNIAVTQSSNPTVNFTLSAADFITVSGTVTKNSSALANADVWITQAQFGPGVGGSRTDTSGNYSITLKKGFSNLYLHAAIPGQGEFYNQLLSSSALNSSTTIPISVSTAIIEIRLAPGNTFDKVFIGAHSSIGHSFTDLRLATSSSYDTYKIEVPYSGSTSYTIDGGIPGFGPIPATTTSISGNTTITIDLGSISFYTVSGTVSATGTLATSTDAFVWAGGSTGGGGTKVGSDGTFSIKLRAGTYDIGVGKAGYTGSILKNQTIATTTTGLVLTLTKNTQTISGTVRYGSTAIANAKVWADNGIGGWSGTVSEADGSFTLYVGSGEWKVGAAAEGYSANPLRITAPASGITISLSVVTFSPERKEQSIKPTEGGVIQTGDAKVEIPSGALGSESTETSIKIQNTMNVPEASGAKIISSKAKSITASYSSGDNTGQTISNLNKSINIEIVLTKTELTSAGISNLDSAKKVKIGYFDETASNWVEITTVVSTNPSDATWATLVSITLKGTTDHLSDFAPMYSMEGAPPTPTNLTATAGNQQVTLSWTASTGATKYDIYRKSGDLYPYLGQTTNTSYTDTGLTNGTTYYYKVSALNDANQESAATEAVSATPAETPSGGGGVLPTGDTTAPSISNIKVTVTDNYAKISWQTNEASISWIVYGTTTAYGLETKTTTSTTSHSLTLTGLSPQTTYHYQIKSKDSTGNIGSYTDQTFTTLVLGEAPKEVVKEEIKAPVKPVAAMTIEELKAEITRITNLIVQLQAELAKFAVPKIFGCTITSFDRTLKIGMAGDDVKCLQIILNSDPETRLAEKGIGSLGKETNLFGTLTKKAVIRFQEKYASEILSPWGFIKGTGLVGKTTRTKLNELLKR